MYQPSDRVRGHIEEGISFLKWLLYACSILVLVGVREAEPMKLRTAPLIFLSTIITHLVGGSAGREGAALQLGGSLAAFVGRQIRLDQKDGRVMVMCGMAAAPPSPPCLARR